MYLSEGKNVKVVGTIWCCSFFEFLVVTFRQHFLVPPPPRVILVFKAIMLPLQEELWRVFFSQTTNLLAGQFAIQRKRWKQVLTIRRATKFIAMLRPLHFNTKIHTCALKIFFLGKICCRAGSKETFLKVGTLSVKARAYPRQIKTKNMNFKYAAISSL